MKFDSHHLFFKALANKGRIQILNFLRDGPKSVGRICKHLGMEQSLVSHNLSYLRTWGFVNSKKQGKKVYYSIDQEHVLPILETLDGYLKQFEQKICSCGVLEGSKSCNHLTVQNG